MPEQSSDELQFFGKSDFPRSTAHHGDVWQESQDPLHFPGEKAGRKHLEGPRQKGVDMSASKVAWEFPWLHRILQSWEKHTMEDAKMTQVSGQG